MPARLSAAVCLVATVAVGGCAGSTHRAAGGSSSSSRSHESLTNQQFNLAVAAARSEADEVATAITSATATIGEGSVTDPNAGPACTSGKLLHIKLIGSFNIATGGLGAQPVGSSDPVSAVLITADAASGQACLIGVRTGPTTPDPGATLLFTK